ncbi:hypothetical protein QJS04_geneDACA021854 [Acorus gramineus]|uniref:DUF4378 domain-containing protein n=1 Tax=Acorus gramineus TaxID=55184 RepID=A0AAV9ATH8_ACOGR|nr:hypothetical protein QJS04_geneDACA021854 [Acorus gramineus]
MKPSVLRVVPDEPHLEKQMGCMAGFFQIFDRHQSVYGSKRFPPSTAVSSTSPSEASEGSPSPSFLKEKTKTVVAATEEPARPSLPLPVLDFKEGMRSSSWKFRESPRLSLDSRVDGKGGLRPREIRISPAPSRAEAEEGDTQRRSPSVVARLMGLEAIPGSNGAAASLRRSASESRVPRDAYRFVSTVDQERSEAVPKRKVEPARAPPPSPPPQHQHQMRKSFFDTQDFFPEKIRAVSMERRMKEEPGRDDLEALKQILEALQLKGLLHSKKSEPLIGHRNFIYDPDRLLFSNTDSPIVVMKPTRPPPSPSPTVSRRGRMKPESPPPPSNPRSRASVTAASRRSPPSYSPPPVRARQQSERTPPSRSTPSDGNARSPSSLARRRQAEPAVQRRSSTAPVCSPRASPRKISPVNRRQSTVRISPDEDEISTISDSSSFSASSLNDSESLKMEEYKEGRRLLERCDRLLHSIAEMTLSADHAKDPEQQPSPVSVLDDSPFLTSSTTPTVRCIDFRDQLEVMSPVGSVESNSTNTPMRIHRKLLSDAAAEILERNRRVSPYEAFTRSRSAAAAAMEVPEMGGLWAEVRRMVAEGVVASSDGDLCEVVRGALKRDLEGRDRWWWDRSGELSELVLGIERLVFKDLIAETIGGLATSARPRRKLFF